jgi:hypothetical protein
VGTAPLTSATLRLTHGSDVETVDWTGNLAQYETATVTLPAVTGTENGNQTFTVEIVSVNGQTDEGNTLNTHSETFMAQVTAQAETATQEFSGSTVSSPWSLDDQTDDYCYIYEGALVFNAYSISNGGRADLYSPLLNFSNHTTPSVSFDLCYKRYNNNSNDKLQIMVSTDCGSTWTTVFDKAGANLATGANTTSNYIADAYETQSIDLSQFAGQEKVIVKFAFTSNYGNNIWIDNIYVGNNTGVEENNAEFNIYPNPVHSTLNIATDEVIESVEIYNMQGQLLMVERDNMNAINVSSLAAGNYFARIMTANGTSTQRFTKE